MPLAAFPKCFLQALVADRTMMLEEWIRGAARLPIDGLEFYWGFTPQEPETIRQTRALMESLNLSMAMMCYSPDFTKPAAAQRAEEIEKQKRVIEVTAALGGRYCRVLSGQRREGVSLDDGLRWASECILALLPHAERFRVTL